MLITAEKEMITTVAYASTFKKRMQHLDPEDHRIIVEELNRIIDGGDVHTSSWIPGSDWRGTLYEPIWISCRQNSTEAAKFYGQILYQVMMDRPEAWGFGNYSDAKGKTYFRLKDL